MTRFCEYVSCFAVEPNREVGENCWDLWFAMRGRGAGGEGLFRDSRNLGILGIFEGDSIVDSSSVSARRFPKGLIPFPGNMVFVL